MAEIIALRVTNEALEQAVNRAVLRRTQSELEHNFALRMDLLGLVEQMCWRLTQFVPHARCAELTRSLEFIFNELDLTVENLMTVLICTRVLEDQFLAESAA
jgi:hypothetical protein